MEKPMREILNIRLGVWHGLCVYMIVKQLIK
jgi:hypothetical protein